MSTRPQFEEPPAVALRRELGKNAESDLGLAILRHVRQWEETKNPHWIDLAIVVVTEANLLIPPCLQVMASHVAMRRLKGLEAAAGGASVVTEEIKGMAFACMATLIGKGAKVAPAAVDAANAIAAIYGSHLYKASTLEKEYGALRAREFDQWERILREVTDQDSGLIDALREHLAALPQLDPGNRRQ
ncbi:MAG: hypothetical protein O9272_08610 [Brevundimonas sp.]|nr:hypothetical protein [Brevundimonas sp.]